MDTVTKPAREAVNTTLTRGDLFSFSWHFYAKQWWLKLPCLLVVIHAIWTQQYGENQTIQGIRLIFFYIILAIGWLLFWALTVLIVSITNVLMTSGVPGILGAHRYEIREDGFFESTSANETLVKWNAIRRITRTGRYILVKLSWFQYHVIPTRSFANAADADSFYQELQSHAT